MLVILLSGSYEWECVLSQWGLCHVWLFWAMCYELWCLEWVLQVMWTVIGDVKCHSAHCCRVLHICVLLFEHLDFIEKAKKYYAVQGQCCYN